MEEQEAEAYAQYQQDMASGEATAHQAAASAEQEALDEELGREETAAQAEREQQEGEHRYETLQDSQVLAQFKPTKGLTFEQLQAQVEEKKRARLILEGRLIQYKADRGWLMEHLHGTSGIAGPYLYNEDWQAFLHMELV